MNDERKCASSKLNFIREKYGELLTIEEVAEVLKYRTVYAVKKAHSRGHLAVELKRFPNRRGLFATAESVAKCIQDFEISED